MADAERTERLRALLVRLKNASSVDTDIAGYNPLDFFRVTSMKFADACERLYKSSDQQPFRPKLKQLEVVLRRTQSDWLSNENKSTVKVTNEDNLHLVGLICENMWPEVYAYAKQLTDIKDDVSAYILMARLKEVQTPKAKVLSEWCTLHTEYRDKHRKEYYAFVWLAKDPDEVKRLYDTI